MRNDFSWQEIVQDFRPLEILYLMDYAEEEKMGFKERVTAFFAYLDNEGIIIRNSDGEYELTCKAKNFSGFRDYEKTVISAMEKKNNIYLGDIIMHVDLAKFFVQAGILKNIFFHIFYKKTHKFDNSVTMFLNFRDSLKRLNERPLCINPRYQAFLYAFPSIVPANHPYEKFVDMISHQYDKYYKNTMMFFMPH